MKFGSTDVLQPLMVALAEMLPDAFHSSAARFPPSRQSLRSLGWRMELTAEDLQEFVKLWKEEFSEDITLEDARKYGSQLLELYVALGDVPTDAVTE